MRCSGVAILGVFCLHNAWSCFTLITLSADAPSAMSLLGIDESQIGTMNATGMVAMIVFLPLGMFSRWRRTLLVAGALMNVLAVPVRYVACLQGQFGMAMLSYVMTGFGGAVILVWPALIAVLLFPEARWGVVIAVAGLSNYVGGAFGALLIPVFSNDTSAGMLHVLEGESYAAIVLLAVTVVFFTIPPVPEETSQITTGEEMRACLKPKALSQAAAFGLAIGISVALQATNPVMLQQSGFSTTMSGAGNCVYQLAAAIVGSALGGLVTTRVKLRSMLRLLHVLSLVSASMIFAVCVLAESGQVGAEQHIPYLDVFMLCAELLLGASLMGMLPLCTQQLVYAATPASENFSCGFLQVICMVVAAILSAFGPIIGGVASAAAVLALTAFEVLVFFSLERWWSKGIGDFGEEDNYLAGLVSASPMPSFAGRSSCRYPSTCAARASTSAPGLPSVISGGLN